MNYKEAVRSGWRHRTSSTLVVYRMESQGWIKSRSVERDGRR